MAYFNREDRRILKGIADKIHATATKDVSIRLSEDEVYLVRRLRMVYNVNPELVVEDWQKSFKDMNESEARITLDIFMCSNKR